MASPAAVAYAQQRASAAAAANAKQQGNAPLLDLERVARIATSKIKSLEAQSKILSKDEVEFIPKFFLGELSLGKVLGKGGFGTVKEIRTINCKADVGVVSVLSLPSSLKDLDVNGLKVQAKEDKKFIADHCLRESGDARYCIKVNLLFVNRRSTDAQCSFYFSLFHTIRQLISPPSTIIINQALSPDIMKDPDLFTQGVIDMCVETMFLAVVSHPHIITMRAIGANGMIKPDYFIILDRLYDTLEARIPKWRLQSKKARSFTNKMMKTSRAKLDELMETKLSYGYDLAGAFEYMHKNK
jgi:hypothetical protein